MGSLDDRNDHEAEPPAPVLDRPILPPPAPRSVPAHRRGGIRGGGGDGDRRPAHPGGALVAPPGPGASAADRGDPRSVPADHPPSVGHRPHREDLPRRPSGGGGGSRPRGRASALSVAGPIPALDRVEPGGVLG